MSDIEDNYRDATQSTIESLMKEVEVLKEKLRLASMEEQSLGKLRLKTIEEKSGKFFYHFEFGNKVEYMQEHNKPSGFYHMNESYEILVRKVPSK